MQDMLVRLYDLPPRDQLNARCAERGIVLRRALAPDKERILSWVREHSGPAAACECDVCFSNRPISLFVATKGPEIVGYACYNATAPDFFGPTRVLDSEQGGGIGAALLLKSLWALYDEGYAYAIIGGVGPAAFYEKVVGATLIEGSTPGIYRDYIGAMKK